MELEVGVRLNRDEGDLTFASTETEAVFMLAAHLPGFMKDEIEVAANEGEKQISIRGAGRIARQEAVITRRVSITREVSVEGFDESFPVPESVDWDGIDAWFDEEEKILFISIPKLLINESCIREEETAEHLIQEEQRVETQELTEEEENGESKLMRPYKGEDKLKEMSGDSMQPSPYEMLQPGTAGVEGPDQVLETDLIESKKEYEEIQIEENREKKREKAEVKTTDEVLEAAQIESEEGRMELPPKESDEEIHEQPMAAEWPEIRKSEIELEGTKDEETQLTGSEIERGALIETKEGYQNAPHRVAKIKQSHEKLTEKPSLLIKEVAEQRKSEEQAEKGMHQTEEEWPQENKNLTEGLPQEKPKTEKLSEPMEPHQKDGKSQLEIIDQVMEAKRPTKSQEKEEEMQKQEQEHTELEQLLHGFKDDEDRQINGPDEEPFRARVLLKSKELSLDLHKQKKEKLTLKAPKEMQEAAEPTKTEKEAKVKPQLQHSQEQEVNERKKPIEVLSYEKMRTTKVQVPKEPDKDLKQYEHEVKEDGNSIEVPPCEMPKAVELPHKEEPKTKAHKLHEDEDHRWMGHVKELSKTIMPQDLEEKYKSFQQEEEYMKEKAKKPTDITPLFEVAESRKFDAAKKDVEQPEQELENNTIIQPPREKVSAKKPSEPNEKVGVKEPDQTLDAGLIQSEDIKEELQEHDDGVQKHGEFIVVPTYEKPNAGGLKQHEQEAQVHEKPIIALTCEKPPVTTPDKGLEDEEHSQPEQLVKEFQQINEELQKKEKLAIVPTCEKSKAAEYSRKEEFQEDKNHQRKGPEVKTSATKKFLKLEEESQLHQQEQEIMKKEAQKTTMRENKRLVEAIEPKQSEEENHVEEELDQPEEEVVPKGKMEIVTTHEEVEKEFQITGKGHDEIIVKSTEPEKQEEWLPQESATLQKELTTILEQIKSKEHHNPTVDTPHQIPDMTEFKAPEEPALSTAKAPKTKEIPKGQEGYQKKESVKSEKPIAGLPFKAPKIKEFRSLEEQEEEFQTQKREYETKNSDQHQSKERQREIQNVMPTYNQEIGKEIQELVDEESFKREIILKSPEKFPEQIKPEKEVQKHKLVIQMEESMIPKQKLLQREEDEMQTAQDFSILKKPETEAVKGKHHSEQNQESKHQKPAEDSSYLASKTTKLMGLEKQELQDKESPVHRRLEPGKTKENKEQREQLRKKPTNQEATTLLVSEEEKDKIAIAKMLEIEQMPELQEPYKKPEKSLSVESKMQLKPTQKVEAEERVCTSLGAELPDKQAIETSKPESQTKEANKVTESSISHVESKEHQKPAVEAPYQTLDMTELKAPEEQEPTTPKKPDNKETPERQQRYQQKESREFEKPVAKKIKETRSLKEKEQELQAQLKEEDKTKSHEPHQSKEKTERLKELRSVMPTYNDEKEMETPQADEEIEQLKSPGQFPKVIKPEKEAQKSMLVKEIEKLVMPKQKRNQLEEKEAPTPQAVLITHQPEPNHEFKHKKPAEKPPNKVAEEQELQEKEVSLHRRPKPWKANEKEEQQRGRLNRKPIKQDETILLDSEAEIEKIPNAKTMEVKGVLESQEPYKRTEETLHVDAELQLKLPDEIEALETLRPAVEGAQLPDKLAVRPSERESQNVQQATESSMPPLQPLESKQRKQLEGPRIRPFMEEVSKQIPEQQLNQLDEEEAHKRESPMQKLARNAAILEPPEGAERTNALMEQELYRYEEGELAQDIESPTQPRPFPSKQEDRKVLQHDDTAVEPPKPLPIIRVMREIDRSPHLLTMEKKTTEPTISPPRVRGAVQPEGLPLHPSPHDEAIKRQFPALIQKELHTYSDIQKPEKEETVSRQMPEFEEAASEQGRKTKEQPAPHIAKTEIERPTDEVSHKIFESPPQEENPPSPFEHEIKTLEASGDDSEASEAQMDKTTKIQKLSKQRHIHCRCHGRRPAFLIPPSTLLSGSAFVFSIMVLVFHFIKRKKSN